MKTRVVISLLIFLAVASIAAAHGGEVHTYMGTITDLHKDGSFILEKTDGKTMHIRVDKDTAYVRPDGKAANPAELKVGSRVVAKIAKDGMTALTIKMSAAKT